MSSFRSEFDVASGNVLVTFPPTSLWCRTRLITSSLSNRSVTQSERQGTDVPGLGLF